MNRFVDVGRRMWGMLANTFVRVMRENGAAYPADKAKVWAGFMSAASGAMAADLGAADAKVVLQGIIGAIEAVTTLETPPAPQMCGCGDASECCGSGLRKDLTCRFPNHPANRCLADEQVECPYCFGEGAISMSTGYERAICSLCGGSGKTTANRLSDQEKT